MGNNGWQPIETAPKDGTRFIAYHAPLIRIAHRHDPGGEAKNSRHHYECWVDDRGTPCNPMYWMPLPNPPPCATNEEGTKP